MSAPVALGSLCLRFLDLPTLLALRQVSHGLLVDVALHLRRNLVLHIRDFVPSAEMLLRALSFSNGFIVGSVAVDYILRSGGHSARTMDILLPNDSRFGAFLFHLLFAQQGRIVFQQPIGQHPRSDHRFRGVQAIARV